jgi:divalent metal cation (Fe/Co/Zn/Cd) transporter
VIGLILAAVAVVLARESKDLLIGERADPAVIARVRAIVAARPEITAVNRVPTIHTSPHSVFVAISADFDDRLTMGAGEVLIELIQAALRREMPELSSIYIRPEKRAQAILA